MKALQHIMRGLIAALFLFTASDGICQLLGEAVFPLWSENLGTVLYFAAALGSLALAYKLRDRCAAKRLLIWSGSVVGGSLLLLLIMAVFMAAGLPGRAVETAIYVLAIVSAPVVSADVPAAGIFGYALILVLSVSLWKKIRSEEEFHGAQS